MMNNIKETLNSLSVQQLINLNAEILKMINTKRRELYSPSMEDDDRYVDEFNDLNLIR